ncbi:MAG: helix-turn-helix transcriptional regulator [Oliverpabstia sp.]|nr:helix-turn-helix transcriptional regulator [Oliverpabstia sp.]
MFGVDNPLAQDPIDFYDETVASRMGNRIRTIRVEKGMSQAELGNLVGLTADRIQKYENGARKPKKDLLKNIAAALGVSTLALVDPNTTSRVGAMYALFELENRFNMKIEKTPEDKPPGMSLTVDFRDSMYEYMKEWYDVYSAMRTEMESASSEAEKTEILKAYHNWEWTFPKGLVDKTSKEMQKRRLKSKIEELQEVYDKLDEE